MTSSRRPERPQSRRRLALLPLRCRALQSWLRWGFAFVVCLPSSYPPTKREEVVKWRRLIVARVVIRVYIWDGRDRVRCGLCWGWRGRRGRRVETGRGCIRQLLVRVQEIMAVPSCSDCDDSKVCCVHQLTGSWKPALGEKDVVRTHHPAGTERL